MEVEFGIVVVIVGGLCEAIKMAGLGSRWVPLAGIVLGISLSFVIPEISLLAGIVGGLTAMGLYDVSKKTIAGK